MNKNTAIFTPISHHKQNEETILTEKTKKIPGSAFLLRRANQQHSVCYLKAATPAAMPSG